MKTTPKKKLKPRSTNYAIIPKREFERIAKKIMKQRAGLLRRLAES